ncbi:hypothetical protein [Hyphomicrobium sp. 99]|uniref:hypothetical protein n=1 Tax=Hyphomicrobium sp. 99 TaxID=1163419 RepID=UPI0005F8122D|nr:hypothetical protein [Hyphomicrobium sp. 99]
MTKQDLRPFWLGLTAGAAVAAIAAALLFANSETVLRKSFQTALNRTSVPAKDVVAANSAPISGSEDYWLTAMRDGTTPVTKAISVGDQISMNLGGVRRTLEVATVSDFSPQITQIDTSSGPNHLVLVTARDLGDSAGRPIRFVMEIQQGGAPVLNGRAGRTL